MSEVLLTAKSMQEAIQTDLKSYTPDQERMFVALLDDGTVLNGHQVNWGNIPLHQIRILELKFGDTSYTLNRAKLPKFVEFVYFNTALRTLKHGEEVLSRSIGWHDGVTEYVVRVAERTGRQMVDTNDKSCMHSGIFYSHHESPPRHLHPTLSKMLLGSGGGN